MKENEKVMVEMTADQAAAYEQFRVKQAQEAAAQKAKEDREAYKQLVDETVDVTIEELQAVSADIAVAKRTALENFKQVLEMKAEVIPRKVIKDNEQRSHTFTNSEGTKRITLGVYVTDGYRDTVEDGIAIVKEELEKLGKDEESRALVRMVMRLLSRDAKGTLKASRIVQLRKTAEEIGNERILEGVRIIEEAYQPAVSKQYIQAQVKDEFGAWVSIPLGMTEA